MLDKSIPFKSLYMKITASDIQKIELYSLPRGFSYQMYQPKDEVSWAEIETSVGEFEAIADALHYFEESFSDQEKLKKRMVFIANDQEEKVATATAYYEILPNGKTTYFLHWVAVKPDYQGLGLGKSVVKKALTIFKELNPGKDVMLHTQTWSHKAIQLYHQLGFYLTKKKALIVILS